MTSKEIQIAIGKRQVLYFHSPVCENISFGFEEMDVMSVTKSGLICEFEVKISRSDFKADFKKIKHQYHANGLKKHLPNYFSYVCPKGLILESELPKYAGLYYYEAGQIDEIVKPPRIHSIKRDIVKIMEKVCRIQSERHFLGSARLTFMNKK